MKAFFRRIWSFVRPYKVRLFLGLVSGIIYGMTNGALIVVINLVVNLVFAGSTRAPVIHQLGNPPAVLRPLAQHITHWLPQLKSPSSRLGLILVVSAIPAIVLLRGLLA